MRIAALDFPVVPPVYCNSAISSSDNLISEIYWSNKSTDTSQESPAGQDVPNFYIDDAYGMRVYLGADIYRSANKLATETDFFKGKLTYYTGDHKITAGYEQTSYDIYNVFIVCLLYTSDAADE